MTMLRVMAAVAGFAALGSMIAGAGVATAQGTCEWYARTAIKQQQENEQKKCGFKGPEWNADLRAHMAWCASVAPDVWKKSAQKRDQDLAACAKK